MQMGFGGVCVSRGCFTEIEIGHPIPKGSTKHVLLSSHVVDKPEGPASSYSLVPLKSQDYLFPTNEPLAHFQEVLIIL